MITNRQCVIFVLLLAMFRPLSKTVGSMFWTWSRLDLPVVGRRHSPPFEFCRPVSLIGRNIRNDAFGWWFVWPSCLLFVSMNWLDFWVYLPASRITNELWIYVAILCFFCFAFDGRFLDEYGSIVSSVFGMAIWTNACWHPFAINMHMHRFDISLTLHNMRYLIVYTQ